MRNHEIEYVDPGHPLKNVRCLHCELRLSGVNTRDKLLLENNGLCPGSSDSDTIQAPSNN